jgi:hypothetical protein
MNQLKGPNSEMRLTDLCAIRIEEDYLSISKALRPVVAAGFFFCSVAAWGQTNACDLTLDGKVDAADVQAAINMSLGTAPCTANIFGPNVCNVVVVQRVVNSSMGGACNTGTGTTVSHSVALNWSLSNSANVTGYKVYRGTISGGPYTLLTSLGVTTSYTDSGVQSGLTYYYVTTAVNGSSESGYSNQTPAVIPVP